MKSEKYDKIRLIFENCDSITLLQEDIEYFYADNISLNISASDGYMTLYKTSSEVVISIKESAFDKYTEFKQMLTDEDEIEYHKLKNRINSSDITQIYLLNEYNDEIDGLCVKWADGDEFHNKYQTQKIIKNEYDDEEYLVINIIKK